MPDSRRGYSSKPEFRVWVKMRQRCYLKTAKDYPRYGGRGIRVCKEWDESFISFFDHVGSRPTPKHSLERLDNNADYEPGNVTWATMKQQTRNRSSTRIIAFNGVFMCSKDWADYLGLSKGALCTRLKNWPVERALSAKKGG